MTLKNFPRGGRKPLKNVHANNELKKKPRSKLRIHKDNFAITNYEDSHTTNILATSADCLNYTTLTQGMVVLGRIREARDYDLIVSLPGRLIGRLELTDISNSYTKLLQSMISVQDDKPEGYKPLTELFKPGDYLVCYVKQLHLTEKWRVSLSLEPELINQNLDRTRIIPKSKIVGTVSSIEEHGYIIDTGVANVRAFLTSKDVDEEKEYFIGQQLFLAIKTVETSESASTLKLSAKEKHSSKAVSQDTQLLDALVPGTKLVLTIKSVLSNGLQVLYNESNIGYINQIYLDNPLSSYETDESVHGTLLYVLPTVKFAYFSLLTEESETEKLNIGDIITNATVMCKEQKGILLELQKKFRGYIPMRRTEVDFEKINSTFKPKSKHKCRVLNYDCFDRVYICSMEKNILNEEYFTATSFAPGELVTAEVTKIDVAYGSVTLKVNKSKGYVPPEHVSDIDKNMIYELKVGQSVKVRALNRDDQRNRVLFTMKQSLVNSNLPILNNIKDAAVGSQHHGTIVQVKNTGLLIKFFGDLKGWAPPNLLGCKKTEIKQKFSIGQVVPATIVTIDKKDNKMSLSLIGIQKNPSNKLRVGETVECIITESSSQGVYVEIHSTCNHKDLETGFLPAAHMSPSLEVASLLAARCTPGDEIIASVFSTTPSIILTTTFVPLDELTAFKNLRVGHYLPCSVREIGENSLKVLLPIDNYSELGVVPYIRSSELELIYVNQVLFGKIISIDENSKKIELQTDLYELWMDSVNQNTEMTNAVDILGFYLRKVKELSNYDFYQSRPISKVSLGQQVSGIIEKVTEDGLVLRLDNDLHGTVRKDQYKQNFKVGDKVSGIIIWLNYVHEIVEITLKSTVVNYITTHKSDSSSIPLGTKLKGEIILVTNWFILIVLKGQGKGRLAALPARRHLNDVQPDLRPYFIGGKVNCYVIIEAVESDLLPVCVLSSTFEPRKLSASVKSEKSLKKRKTDDAPKVNLQSKKAKLDQKDLSKDIDHDIVDESINDNTSTNSRSKTKSKKSKRKVTTEVERETNVDNEIIQNSSCDNQGMKDSTSGIESKKNKMKESKREETNVNEIPIIDIRQEEKVTDKSLKPDDLSIPACGFYWNTEPTPQEELAVESSSDSDEEAESPQKKKKLSAAERREQERQKEREIREREEALASNQLPNSVDQFDRLVMSSPNSSVVWVQYMAYHLQATEIEKARAVAKRAIKTINFREENEKLNVWQAWLNLESRFGTLESMNEVFQEAVRTNDAFKVYTHMLTLHANANRQAALDKTITTITGKFKQNPLAWIESGIALLKMRLKDRSRHIMQRALQSLPAHQHVDLMVRFAQLENKYGDKERAQTLFEKILSSYPKRVDVWSAYVDALIKSADIPIARQVLERAAAQTLPARKMKTIFKKYIAFEEHHGTAENVIKVQEMARNYIENQSQ
ncbi:rRNA biogenesis protein RRP5 [Neodiprion pinetum]|uniref:rRNA biogenesis protein RRP5 n=1 Tax=Neodiprion pinetum TaxID=441929 RepID=UPI001EDCA913|nr:protein RRP5 homolog [Neodiprion pinetum]XP_046478495.1 protein RRP5 homolog [Neodiprion pinetum]